MVKVNKVKAIDSTHVQYSPFTCLRNTLPLTPSFSSRARIAPSHLLWATLVATDVPGSGTGYKPLLLVHALTLLPQEINFRHGAVVGVRRLSWVVLKSLQTMNLKRSSRHRHRVLSALSPNFV